SVSTAVGLLTQTLTVYRTSAAHGGGMTTRGVEDLKIRCRAAIQLIDVMQERMQLVTTRLEVGLARDQDSQAVRERLIAIRAAENKELEALPRGAAAP